MDLTAAHQALDELWRAGPGDARLRAARFVRAFVDAVEAIVVRELRESTPVPEPIVAEAAGTGLRDAERVVARAELLAEAPALAAGLASASLTSAHVDAVVRVAQRLEPAERRTFLAATPQLAALGASTGIAPFAKAVAAAADAARKEPEVDRLTRQVRDNRLSLCHDAATGRWRLSGSFDPMSGSLLRDRLDHAAKAIDAGDAAPANALERHAWKLAQALVRLTERGTTHRPALVVDERGRKVVHDWGVVNDVPRELTEQLAAYADPTVVVIRHDGTIDAPGRLDWGRERRHAVDEQRLPLRALYPTCAIPGCDVRFNNLEIHHVHPWHDGGCTDLGNLLPICKHHHRRIHAEGWSLVLRPDRTLTITYPGGATATTGPPRRSAA